MDERRLKEVMNRVHIKSEMEEEILKNLMNETGEQATQKKANKSSGWQKKVAVAAVALVAVGTVGFSANAIRNNLVKERMEAVPQLEMDEVLDQIDAAQVDADTYSRDLTSEEESRRSALHSEYLNGRFPEKELIKVSEESDIVDKDVLCFAAKTSYFNIPDRDLTDEEILQMIDFSEQRIYALQKRYEEEYADEIQEKEEKEQALKAELEAKGGITEEEAVIKAQELFLKLFGKTPEGYELNHFLMTDDNDGNPVYVVSYAVIGESYSFVIRVADGSLVDISGPALGMSEGAMKTSDVEAKIPALYQKAQDWLKNKLGVSDEFAETYYSYTTNGDVVRNNSVMFYFVKEDGTGCCVTYLCTDDNFLGYYVMDNYEEYLAQQKENDDSMISGSMAEALAASGDAMDGRVTKQLR